jgi:hypothetical protein
MTLMTRQTVNKHRPRFLGCLMAVAIPLWIVGVLKAIRVLYDALQSVWG